MKRKLGIVLACLLVLSVLAGCAEDAGSGLEGENHVKQTMYISFDEDGAQVTEMISQKNYPVHYVFENAKYKQPESAKRVDGVSGKALSFDGYSTFVEAEAVAEDTKALTVSLWVAPRAYATRTDGKLTGLVSSLGVAGGFDLGMYNYGTWCFEAITNKGSYKLWSEEVVIDLYQWNYLTAVFDGKAGQMRLYKNGIQVASCDVSANTVKAGDGGLLIGKSQNAAMVDDVFTANMFGGLMDELEIRQEVLTDEQILANYERYADAKVDLSQLWLDAEILSDDRYAPQYHLRVSQNWQNETYGFFYYNGYYHAFCQQNVLGPYYTDGQRWGHFVSTDLVHWEELTPALVPEDNGIDRNHVFSGCAILMPNGEPKLFYTGVDYSQTYLNLIATATAADLTDPKLTAWNKTGNVVVEQGDLSTTNNFRDPFIYVENGEYFMLIGGTNKETGGGAIYCFKATDDTLENWQYLNMLYSGDSLKYAFLGNCYELPNLFRLESRDGKQSKYLLMFSPIGNINGVYYLLGDFDAKTGTFIPEREEPQRYDLGPKSQVLCPAGFYDTNTGRNLLITMSRTGLSAQERYDSGWSTVMTLVKELYLSDDGELLIKPIGEYDSLNKGALLQQEDVSLTVKEANELLKSVSGYQLRIELTVEAEPGSKVGIYVKHSAASGERVDIFYDLASQELGIDTSKSSLDMRNNGAGSGVAALQEGEAIQLTVFVDRAMVEAYLNGKNQVTAFGYNASADSEGLKLYSSGGEATVTRLVVYELESSTGYDVPAFWDEQEEKQ